MQRNCCHPTMALIQVSKSGFAGVSWAVLGQAPLSGNTETAFQENYLSPVALLIIPFHFYGTVTPFLHCNVEKMKRKIDLKRLKYPFRSLYLAKCATEGQQPNFGALKETVASLSGSSKSRIERLMLAKQESLLTAKKNELDAFAKALSVEARILTVAFVYEAGKGAMA